MDINVGPKQKSLLAQSREPKQDLKLHIGMIIHDMRSPCVSIKLGLDQAKKLLEKMDKEQLGLDHSVLSSSLKTIKSMLSKRKSNLDIHFPNNVD